MGEVFDCMRKLYSAGIPCQADCKYCFAKWDNMYSKLPQLVNEQIYEKEAVIYPCCDGEFFEQHRLIEYVKKAAENMDKVYLSISTKRFISDDEISCIARLNQELLSSGKGFVKLAVSVSNMSMLDKIEPKTMTYGERIELAKKINSAGIFTALTIKPILPFISSDEYCQIISDFEKFTKYVLIGGLYLNRDTEFFSQYITSENLVRKRNVGWLPEHPEWSYVQDDNQLNEIRTYANKKGVFVFDSDVELIKAYIEREE